jgi:hypothetical protein
MYGETNYIFRVLLQTEMGGVVGRISVAVKPYHGARHPPLLEERGMGASLVQQVFDGRQR